MFGIRKETAATFVALALLAAGCTANPPPAVEGHSGIVQGVVTDASGQPLAGAFVKLKNDERRLTFMVVSQDGGRYAAEKLPPGNYMVQGVGNDFQSAWSAPINLAEQGSAGVDIILTDARASSLPAAWPRRIPEEMATAELLPEGPGKDIITGRCVSCHVATQIVANRYEPGLWRTSIDEMRSMMRDGGLTDLTDEEAATLLDYVTANLPPLPAPDPNSRFPRTLMQGEARNYRVVQYDFDNAGAEPHDVAVDPWGVGWANQRIGGKISRFDPVTYEYSEISPPLYTAERARPGNLQIGADGIMWLPEPFETRWLSYDIANAKWTDWPFPTGKIRGQVQGNSMALHPDGTIWSSGPGAARRLNPATGEWGAWDAPTWTKTNVNPGGYGITVAGDGRVWFAMNLVDRLARVDGTTGVVDEFAVPVEGVSYPRRMDTDPAGDVWVGLWGAGKLLKINHKTDEMTVLDPPTPHNGAYAISFDMANNLLWVTLHKVDMIARYNPATGEWLEFPLPQAETDVRRIEVDQNNPNRVWWSSVANNARIGYLELLEE